MNFPQDVEVVQPGAGSVMFVGGATGLSVFETGGKEGPCLLAQSEVMNVKTIEVGCSMKDDCNVHIIAVILESGENSKGTCISSFFVVHLMQFSLCYVTAGLVKIFGYIRIHLVSLTDITTLVGCGVKFSFIPRLLPAMRQNLGRSLGARLVFMDSTVHH